MGRGKNGVENYKPTGQQHKTASHPTCHLSAPLQIVKVQAKIAATKVPYEGPIPALLPGKRTELNQGTGNKEKGKNDWDHQPDQTRKDRVKRTNQDKKRGTGSRGGPAAGYRQPNVSSLVWTAFWSVAGYIFQNSTNSLLNALKTLKTNLLSHQQSVLLATPKPWPSKHFIPDSFSSAVAGHTMGTWILVSTWSSPADDTLWPFTG